MNTTLKNSIPSPYLPRPCLVERVTRLTEKERLFRLSPVGQGYAYDPGQFFMTGLPGYGEAPISAASYSAPGDGGHAFELCIRAVGNLTNALHRLKKGDTLWVRGPFGTGFDVDMMKGKDLLFIAGGIGVAPMRGLIQAVLADRGAYGGITMIYGAKSPEEMLFASEIKQWKASGMECLLTIDRPSANWKGNVGVVTSLTAGLRLKPDKTVAVIIGPPVMYRFAVLSLWDKRIPKENIFVSLERRMKCGVGKCGHCQINSVYTCREGPVFRLSDLKNLPDAL